MGVLLDRIVMGAIVGTELLTKELEKYQKTNGCKRRADLTLSIDENDKKVRWTFEPNQNAQSLFCRQMCVDAYLEQFNETIDRLPNLVSV